MTEQNIKEMSPMDVSDYFLNPDKSPLEQALIMAMWLAARDEALGVHIPNMTTDQAYLEFLKTSCENGHLAEAVTENMLYIMEQAKDSLSKLGVSLTEEHYTANIAYKEQIANAIEAERERRAEAERAKDAPSEPAKNMDDNESRTEK